MSAILSSLLMLAGHPYLAVAAFAVYLLVLGTKHIDAQSKARIKI